MTVTVMTFSPTELSSGDAVIQSADGIAAAKRAGKTVIVVVSAMAGVTELLLDSIQHGNYGSVYTKLLASHTSAARRLARDEGARKVLIQDVTDILDSYNWLGKSLANRTPTPGEADNIATLGERLSVRLLAANLQGRGIQTATLTAAEMIVSGDEAAQATRIRNKLTPLLEQGYLPITTALTGMNTPYLQLANLILAALNAAP